MFAIVTYTVQSTKTREVTIKGKHKRQAKVGVTKCCGWKIQAKK